MHERGVAEALHAPLAEVELNSDVLAERGHTLGVAGCVTILGLEGENQGFDRLLLARLQLEELVNVVRAIKIGTTRSGTTAAPKSK